MSLYFNKMHEFSRKAIIWGSHTQNKYLVVIIGRRQSDLSKQTLLCRMKEQSKMQHNNNVKMELNVNL